MPALISSTSRRYITGMQIIQFVSCVPAFFVTLGMMAHGSECAGAMIATGPRQTHAQRRNTTLLLPGAHAMAFNLVFNMSLLHGFFGVLSVSKKSRTD